MTDTTVVHNTQPRNCEVINDDLRGTEVSQKKNKIATRNGDFHILQFVKEEMR